MRSLARHHSCHLSFITISSLFTFLPTERASRGLRQAVQNSAGSSETQ